MNKDEALKLALEALENFKEVVVAAQVLGIKVGATGKNMRLGESFLHDEAIAAINEALAPKEPKCIVKDCENHSNEGVFIGSLCRPCHKYITTGASNPFYTTPPKQGWVGLTDKHIGIILNDPNIAEVHCGTWLVLPYAYAYAIEAKLKELNI